MNGSEILGVISKGLSGLFPDIAFIIAILLELLVFVIKLLVWRKEPIKTRLAKLLIDEPLNLMAIVLGYIGALIAFNKNMDTSVFILFIAILIGLLIMSYFYETIVDFYNSSEKHANLFCALFVLVSYILPFLELLVYAYFIGRKA